jgi:membrane peptidoglycan carboxypeptidase
MTRQDLLDRMLAADVITRAEYDAAIKEHASPAPQMDADRYRVMLAKAAAHRRCGLRPHELEHLARTFGGTVE